MVVKGMQESWRKKKDKEGSPGLLKYCCLFHDLLKKNHPLNFLDSRLGKKQPGCQDSSYLTLADG